MKLKTQKSFDTTPMTKDQTKTSKLFPTRIGSHTLSDVSRSNATCTSPFSDLLAYTIV